MKKLNVAKVFDQYGWAYDFLDREQRKYSYHNIIPMKHDEVNLDNIDILYIHSPDISAYAREALPLEAKKRGIPVIGAYAGVVDSVYSYADLLLTISPQSYWLVKSRYPKHQTVFMPESIDTRFFKPDNTYDKFRVGWAGRPCRVKRPWILEKLKFPIIKQQEWGKSHFKELRSLKPMRAFYHSIDCLVLTSASECMPRVIMEAMACGLPVISTDVGGVKMLLDSNYVVPNTSEKSIIQDMNIKLEELSKCKDTREAIGYMNRIKVEKFFSWKSTYRLWDDLFTCVYLKDDDAIDLLNDEYLGFFPEVFEENKNKYYNASNYPKYAEILKIANSYGIHFDYQASDKLIIYVSKITHGIKLKKYLKDYLDDIEIEVRK